MKKFLTVLLALSVVFTYTFGSAFALPSDESTEAGLASAKAEAIAELNAYDLSDYSASDQAVMKGIIAKAIEDINDAVSVKYGYEKIKFPYTTNTSVKFACYYNGIYNHNDTEYGADTYQLDSVKNIFKDVPSDKVTNDNVYKIIENGGVEGILTKAQEDLAKFSKTSELEKARKDAVKQFNDYVYLIDRLSVKADFDKAVEDAKIGCANYADLKAKAVAAIEAATDVKSVEKALNTYIEKADKVYAQLEEVEVSQADIDDLVKKIRAEASAYKVNSATHSPAVVNAFEAAIEEGVKEAKAVNTWDEYFKVSDKYLGYNKETKADYEEGDVRVHIKQESVFKQYANKTKDVERSIKAVNALLADLGEYNWKDYPADTWEDIEDFYYEAAYYVKNGQFDNIKTDVAYKACNALKTLVESVKAADTTNQFNDKVAAAYDAIDALTNLSNYKTTLKIANYTGTTVGGGAAKLEDYGDNESLVKSLQALGQNAVNAADSIKAADEAYANYTAKIDKVNTEDEILYNENLAKGSADVDNYVAVNTSADLTADQKVFLERFVKDWKVAFAKALVQDVYLTVEPADAKLLDSSTMTLKNVVAGVSYTKANATNNGYKFETATTADYSTENAGHVNAVIQGFNEKATAAKSWKDFFAAYDKAAKDIDAYLTKPQEAYVDAIDAFNTAVAALGTPVYTAAYKSQLDKLDSLYTNYTNAKKAFDKLAADEQAEITKTITGVDTFNNAKAEYERLAYLADNNKVEGSTIPEVTTFIKIATDFVSDEIQQYYSVSGKQEIAQIIDETYSAIESAASKEAKAEAALKGIEKLDAVPINTRGAQDVADLIAEVKAEAAKYFTKYESASFTSDATTKIGLVQDIIKFNEQFSDSVAEANAQRIADTEAMKIVTSTKLYKGSKIRVKWRIAEGNTASIDGYQVWKSTKAQSGYKFMGKTKKLYMDNKKELKKGKRYYYKVRAYVEIDGQKYFSDWSNKGNRIYK